MKHTYTQEERLQQMLNEPVKKLIPGLAVPTIISMLVSAIYNMADTFFVSQISTSASAAVGVIFSLMAFIQAIGFLMGQGAGVSVAKYLGRKQTEEASVIAAVSYFTTLFIGLIVFVSGTVFLKPMIYLLGATDTIYPYAADYCRYILIAAPFMISSFVMNNLLRNEGNAFFAMIGISAGGILNLFLDPLMIFGFGWGIAGAAIATMLSQMISFGILLWQCNTRTGCIPLRWKNFKPTAELFRTILHVGLPSFCRQGLASLATVILNVSAVPFGDAAIAAMSIVNRIIMMIYSGMLGFGQGFQPVCSYNFGARRYDRILDAFRFSVKVAVIWLTSLGVIAFASANPLITAFRRNDPEVIRIGVTALRFYVLTLPVQAWVVLVNMLTQSIGYGFRSSIVSLGKQGIYFIPAILILPHIIGITGIEIAQPVADIFTAITATVIVIPVLRSLKNGTIPDEEPPLGVKFARAAEDTEE